MTWQWTNEISDYGNDADYAAVKMTVRDPGNANYHLTIAIENDTNEGGAATAAARIGAFRDLLTNNGWTIITDAVALGTVEKSLTET